MSISDLADLIFSYRFQQIHRDFFIDEQYIISDHFVQFKCAYVQASVVANERISLVDWH